MESLGARSAQEKRLLRTEVRSRIGALSLDLRRQLDQRIGAHLLDWLSKLEPGLLLITRSLPDEVGLDPCWPALCKAGWTLVLPRMTAAGDAFELVPVSSEADWTVSKLGTSEPLSHLQSVGSHALAAALLPARAISLSGQRLGRGRGCFDRFLAGIPQKLPIAAVVYSAQVFPYLPTQPHDRPIPCWIDELGWHAAKATS